MPKFLTFIIGLIFAIGLGISGMTQPAKVIGFLDIFSGWDPSLAFVMCGAIGVHFIAYQIQKKSSKPAFGTSFVIPKSQVLTPQLLGGSALFGIGWAVGGFCPGPAIVSTVSLHPKALIFFASMAVGMTLFHFIKSKSPTLSVN